MNQDLVLIEEVKLHPELYDNTHPHFKTSEVKQEIWSQVARHVWQNSDSESVRKVKTRWKGLRDTYVKYTREQYTIPRKKSWRYSQAMSFLAPCLLGSSAKGPRRKIHELHDDVEEMSVEPVENFFVAIEDLKDTSEDEGCRSEVLSPETHLEISPPGEYLQSDSRGDDLDSFFKGISDTVKKLSPENQVRIQRDIVNMVLDVKLQEINDKTKAQSSMMLHD